jgi:hypothetical protein
MEGSTRVAGNVAQRVALESLIEFLGICMAEMSYGGCFFAQKPDLV